jgi:chromosome segregation ATPase
MDCLKKKCSQQQEGLHQCEQCITWLQNELLEKHRTLQEMSRHVTSLEAHSQDLRVTLEDAQQQLASKDNYIQQLEQSLASYDQANLLRNERDLQQQQQMSHLETRLQDFTQKYARLKAVHSSTMIHLQEIASSNGSHFDGNSNASNGVDEVDDILTIESQKTLDQITQNWKNLHQQVSCYNVPHYHNVILM